MTVSKRAFLGLSFVGTGAALVSSKAFAWPWTQNAPANTGAHAAPVAVAQPVHHDEAIIAEDVNTDMALERNYTVKLNNSISLTMNASTSFEIRTRIAYITQGDDRTVYFNPDSPADKILDREILPEVLHYCPILIQMDSDFIASDPDHVRDGKGRLWKRVTTS